MEDTIAAVATPCGKGGIGIVRISGPKARAILSGLFTPAERDFAGFVPWKLHRGVLRGADGGMLDDALVVFMPGPRTFTGEDVAELHCHGAPSLLQAVLDEVLRQARPAGRGEFSRRAYLNGRMDLTQAEAVAELIDAPSREGALLAANKVKGLLGGRVRRLSASLEDLRSRLCLAVDFPEDEVPPLPVDELVGDVEAVIGDLERLLGGVERTRVFREALSVVLAGPVNAGKSSLMNALLGRERAIVTDVPGTTRDFLEESVSLDGMAARLVDTAGLREAAPGDAIEAEGIRRGLGMVRRADMVLLVVDGSVGVTREVRSFAASVPPERLVVVWNKADLVPPPEDAGVPCAAFVAVSALRDEGIDALAATVRRVAMRAADAVPPTGDEVVPNVRQADALRRALEHLTLLRDEAARGVPYELCAVRLEEAARALDAVVGINVVDDVLNRIFERFCVGK